MKRSLPPPTDALKFDPGRWESGTGKFTARAFLGDPTFKQSIPSINGHNPSLGGGGRPKGTFATGERPPMQKKVSLSEKIAVVE